MLNIIRQNNIFLAPMAGITDLPFRILCKEQGCGLVTTEMISAKGILYGNENTEFLLATCADERPVSVQIFGSDPDILARMASKIEENYPGIDVIDINMGCPAPKIVKNNEGSALMKDPELVGKIVKAVSSAVTLPLTIKIRKGFSNNMVNAVDIAKRAEENGCAAITIHGRTREQYYSGQADWSIIKQIKQSVSIPVIGNGDVTDGKSAAMLLQETGCDAVMVGRAAQGDPWIFAEIQHYLKTGSELKPPSTNEKIATALRHTRLLIEHKGEYTALREMRKHLCWYIKGMNGAAKLRTIINKTETFTELETIMQSLKDLAATDYN